MSTDAAPRPELTSFVAGLPKAELHVHHVGSASPRIVAELAGRHPDSPVPQDPEALVRFFTFTDFAHFIDVYLATVGLLRTAQDVRMLTYEVARDLSGQQVRYAELTMTPYTSVVRGIPIEAYTEAIEDARVAAERDHGVVLRWIYDIPGESGLESADATLTYALDHRPEALIAIPSGVARPEPMSTSRSRTLQPAAMSNTCRVTSWPWLLHTKVSHRPPATRTATEPGPRTGTGSSAPTTTVGRRDSVVGDDPRGGSDMVISSEPRLAIRAVVSSTKAMPCGYLRRSDCTTFAWLTRIVALRSPDRRRTMSRSTRTRKSAWKLGISARRPSGAIAMSSVRYRAARCGAASSSMATSSGCGAFASSFAKAPEDKSVDHTRAVLRSTGAAVCKSVRSDAYSFTRPPAVVGCSDPSFICSVRR